MKKLKLIFCGILMLISGILLIQACGTESTTSGSSTSFLPNLTLQ